MNQNIDISNLSPMDLRNTARYLEKTALPALASYSRAPIALRSGGLREFPRPSREDQAAEQGFVALRGSINETVSALYALAFAMEQDLEVPDTLLLPLLPSIEAYEVYRKRTDETKQAADFETEAEAERVELEALEAAEREVPEAEAQEVQAEEEAVAEDEAEEVQAVEAGEERPPQAREEQEQQTP